MVDQSKPSAKCYSILLITGIACVLLFLTVPLALNKTHKASHCNDNAKNDTGPDVYVPDIPGNNTGYVINDDQTTLVVEEDIEKPSCTQQILIAVLLWIPVVIICFSWLFLLLLIVYSDNIKAYRAARAKEKAELPVKPAICCNGLRAQIWHYQCKQYKRTFMKHPMLHHLDPNDTNESQILNYIKSYLTSAWQTRPKEFQVDDSQDYDIKVRHVFRINNEKVWNNFDGDQSSLEDIIRNLTDIRVPDLGPGPSFRSQYSVPSRMRTDSGGTVPHEVGSCVGTTNGVSERESSLSKAVDEQDNNNDDGEVDGGEQVVIEPEESSATQEGPGTSTEPHDDTHHHLNNNDDASSIQSAESLPLLARSWRLSFTSIRTMAPSENCMFLLYGTQIENVLPLVERGLDPTKAPHVGYYGKIMSLSESSWVADKYTDSLLYPRDKNLVMLIMRTSLKHAYWRLNDEHIPPSITKTYDAVVSGNKKGYREFRIFKTKCCYPEFLVYYDRVRPNSFLLSL